MSTLGNGIVRPSARPIKIYVDKQGEVWLCDETVDQNSDFSAQGCSPTSANPQND
jgi:streptogramin lyase